MSLPASQVLSALTSAAKKLGTFRIVLGHEPKSAPVALPACCIWWNDPLRGDARSSGQAAVTVVTGFAARVYQAKMLEQPEDDIDVKLLRSTELLLEALAAGFTLGGQVRNVDLLGMTGSALSATPGYITHENTTYRVAEVTIPVIINDAWPEAA